MWGVTDASHTRVGESRPLSPEVRSLLERLFGVGDDHGAEALRAQLEGALEVRSEYGWRIGFEVRADVPRSRTRLREYPVHLIGDDLGRPVWVTLRLVDGRLDELEILREGLLLEWEQDLAELDLEVFHRSHDVSDVLQLLDPDTEGCLFRPVPVEPLIRSLVERMLDADARENAELRQQLDVVRALWCPGGHVVFEVATEVPRLPGANHDFPVMLAGQDGDGSFWVILRIVDGCLGELELFRDGLPWAEGMTRLADLDLRPVPAPQ